MADKIQPIHLPSLVSAVRSLPRSDTISATIIRNIGRVVIDHFFARATQADIHGILELLASGVNGENNDAAADRVTRYFFDTATTDDVFKLVELFNELKTYVDSQKENVDPAQPGACGEEASGEKPPTGV